jgi:hypothetical protein
MPLGMLAFVRRRSFVTVMSWRGLMTVSKRRLAAKMACSRMFWMFRRGVTRRRFLMCVRAVRSRRFLMLLFGFVLLSRSRMRLMRIHMEILLDPLIEFVPTWGFPLLFVVHLTKKFR